jgi:hypothetical protein
MCRISHARLSHFGRKTMFKLNPTLDLRRKKKKRRKKPW